MEEGHSFSFGHSMGVHCPVKDREAIGTVARDSRTARPRHSVVVPSVGVFTNILHWIADRGALISHSPLKPPIGHSAC